MIKLQCENCFSDVLPTQYIKKDEPTLFQCQGCHTYYLYDGKLVETQPPWQPEGYVEDPNGCWVPYFVYSWRDPRPPYIRYIGFKSVTYEKQVELEIPLDIRRTLVFNKERVMSKVIQAIEEVLPPGFDKYEADLSHIFRELF